MDFNCCAWPLISWNFWADWLQQLKSWSPERAVSSIQIPVFPSHQCAMLWLQTPVVAFLPTSGRYLCPIAIVGFCLFPAGLLRLSFVAPVTLLLVAFRSAQHAASAIALFGCVCARHFQVFVATPHIRSECLPADFLVTALHWASVLVFC